MSRIRADRFVNSGATGAPQLTFGAEVVAGVGLTGAGGINITGIATAASFSGNVTGNVTGNTSGTAGGLTGTPNIDCGTGSFTGDVDIADKIVHTSDTNTAIRFPAVDTFAVETAGSERLRVDSGGKVGVNINNPGSYNSAGNEIVLGNTGNNGGMTIVSGTGNNGHIFFADGTGTPNQGIIKYEHANDAMAFNTNTGERLRILSGGGITFNGDSATANALDDYEEGTWSPSIGGTAAYDIRWGYYIKIGKSVQCWGGLRPSSMGTGNAKQIQDLPFTSINSPATTYTGGGSIVWHDNCPSSITNTPALAVQPNSTYATINAKTAASTTLQDAVNFWQNNHRANFFITYQTN